MVLCYVLDAKRSGVTPNAIFRQRVKISEARQLIFIIITEESTVGILEKIHVPLKNCRIHPRHPTA